jgi:hypothetical protein
MFAAKNFLLAGGSLPIATAVEYLVVAGGGSGSNYAGAGGGGGAGGYRTATGLSISPATPYTVTVGAGGTIDGSNSVFSTITSTGGGGADGTVGPGRNGGSGSGGSTAPSPKFNSLIPPPSAIAGTKLKPNSNSPSCVGACVTDINAGSTSSSACGCLLSSSNTTGCSTDANNDSACFLTANGGNNSPLITGVTTSPEYSNNRGSP